MSKGAQILCVAGARPNFMKVAPILVEIRRRRRLSGILVHTGQHYDEAMSDSFFRDLRIPPPDLHLGIGSDRPGRQIARILEALEEEFLRIRPACALVVGDVNSTLAAALAAVKTGVPVAHVEAGLRSRDREMPEELNRALTDAASDLLFTTSPDADENLRREGIPAERIHLVGNVMIDTLRRFEEASRSSTILEDIGVEKRGYALLTLHRPSNVDRREDLLRIVMLLQETARRLPAVLPIHPRTRGRLDAEGLLPRLENTERLFLRPPASYLDFLHLMKNARVVMTDSGGIQEETTVLGVPCLTLRANTERPITITEGTNRLVGLETADAVAALDEVLALPPDPAPRIPALWDGRAAERIVDVLERVFARED